MQDSLAISVSRALSPTEAYAYMRDHLLLSCDTQEQMISRVKEIYFDVAEEMNTPPSPYGYIFPDVYSIASRIDEENCAIIGHCCESNFVEDDIDIIQAMYNHDIACMLDDWVKDALYCLSLPVNGYYHAHVGIPLLSVSQNIAVDQLKFPFWKEWEM